MRHITITKQKDGEEGGRWSFELEVVHLGYDSRGEQVTSCTVAWVERPGRYSAELDQVARDTADNQIFLDCLRERNRQQRRVSEAPSASYAPIQFATMDESKKIGRSRLEAAMGRLFKLGRIERGELWRGPDRKMLYGLREVAADDAVNAAQQTQQTARKTAEKPAANAANTHSSPKGEGAPSAAPPLEYDVPDGFDA